MDDYDRGVYAVILSFTVLTTISTMLAACLCCRRKVPKNDLLGLEGMMKIKNPDENLLNSTQKLNNATAPGAGGPAATQNDAHSVEQEKRASSATHRSLPDIPVIEHGGNATGDTNSDLYATVGDKIQQLPQDGNVNRILKQTSISQHSSLSQADDISSPYASVRSPPHAYDKIRKAEHPYAQLQPTAVEIAEASANNSRRASNESLLATDTVAEIPAASAIAGRVSASQELPYMTPPIVQPTPMNQPHNLPPQHFSGDSQDSSKGYTSISVREPLANILAQTKNAQRKNREISADSHYATVSDDSDEMYAAIEDPNNPVDLYTSGSETYAQIQPMVVNVEVNAASNPPPQRTPNSNPAPTPVAATSTGANSNRISADVQEMAPPVISQLITSQHSRQASSSSSIGNLGSPKPEKRQANSPLPPTPKTSAKQKPHYLSNSTLNSGRNSVNSSVDFSPNSKGKESAEEVAGSPCNTDSNKKKTSPSKDLEGMYAKVMKKNKLSNISSENSSPVLSRKGEGSPESQILRQMPTDVPDSAPVKDNSYETIERVKVTRRNSFKSNSNKDPGYETIPGDKCKRDLTESLNAAGDFQPKMRTSAPAGIIGGLLAEGIHQVSQNSLQILQGMDEFGAGVQPLSLQSDPGYETVRQGNETASESDPNYEVLKPAKTDEDGYSKIASKGDAADGYSSIKRVARDEEDVEPGYSKIKDKEALHGYASIDETRNIQSKSDTRIPLLVKEQASTEEEVRDHNYQTINEAASTSPMSTSFCAINQETSPGYSSISEPQTTPSSDYSSSDVMVRSRSEKNYESLPDDPNYESIKYLDVMENPYELLESEKNSPIDPKIEEKSLPDEEKDRQIGKKSPSGESIDVADYYQV